MSKRCKMADKLYGLTAAFDAKKRQSLRDQAGFFC